MILLDTDVAVDVVREVPNAVRWISGVTDVLAISGFTSIELFSGCRSAAEQKKLQRTLARFQVVWLSPAGCAGALKTYLRQRLAHGIGAFDCLIGQTALELREPLHTFNLKHFQHVPGLRTIQPYIR